MCVILRNYVLQDIEKIQFYLGLVIEGAMDSFLDRSLPTVTIQKQRELQSPSEWKDVTRGFTNTMKGFYGEREGKLRAREELTALKERRGRRGVQCVNCQEFELESQKFQRCKPCWDKAQRTVFYCSM
jgi:hypothetical protein